MKTRGKAVIKDSYIRKIEANHRITIPETVLNAIGVTEEYPEIELYRVERENGGTEFRIRSAAPRDFLTGQSENLVEYKGYYFSADTIQTLHHLLEEQEQTREREKEEKEG